MEQNGSLKPYLFGRCFELMKLAGNEITLIIFETE